MIPRISLWTPEVDIPVRIAVQGFDEHHLTTQARQIQNRSGFQILTISPGAMYILSHIAGRRIVEPIRWVLLDSLREIVVGNLRTVYPERQDLLGSTFGEMLGALLLAVELGTSTEIVRLLEGEEKTPDFLLLQPGEQGSTIGHLLECKGFVEDLHNVNQRKRMDLCGHIRSFRTEGRAQLEGARPSNLRFGARVTLRSGTYSSALGHQAASLNLAVVCIPDARIPRSVDPQVKYPPEKRCAGQGYKCVDCIASPVNSRHTNVISVMHRKEGGIPSSLGPDLQDMIGQYRKAQRALWAEEDERFAEETNRLLTLPLREYPSFLLLATTLIEEASELTLDIRQIEATRLEPSVDRDAREIRKRIQQVMATVERSQERESPYYERIDDERVCERIRSTEMPRWRKSLLSGVSTQGHQISGTVDWQDDVALIRVFIDGSSPEAFQALVDHVDSLISQLRGGAWGRQDWKPEFVECDDRRLDLGVSWDEFPYRHPKEPLPGITAWVARDGRAEVIVRTRPLAPS